MASCSDEDHIRVTPIPDHPIEGEANVCSDAGLNTPWHRGSDSLPVFVDDLRWGKPAEIVSKLPKTRAVERVAEFERSEH